MDAQISQSHITISPSILPSDESIVFQNSSFFKQHPSLALPLPAQVRIAAASQMTDTMLNDSDPNEASLVRFLPLNLVVKYGRYITIAEGQSLWAIRHFLGNDVPVPEVYGWCRDGKSVFIYMQLVQGPTLEQRWETLSTEERVTICKQLNHMMRTLHRLQQPQGDPFVGHIGRQPLQDIIFASSCSPSAGPFPTVQSFHDYFVRPAQAYDTASNEPPHPMRSGLPDNVPIKFTHGDLSRSNIIVSPEGAPAHVAAIVDWHQAGWLPEYWEFCKARWTTHIGEEWETDYLPKILTQYEGYDYWDYFVLKLGV